MSFRHLDQTVIKRLIRAAIDGGLLEVQRPLLLAGIQQSYVLSLRSDIGSPLDQFQIDIDSMNKVERLIEGQVPLIQFLDNAALQLNLRSRSQSELFERCANQLRNQTLGIRGLPDSSQLPEIIRDEAIIHQDDTVSLTFLHGALSVAHSVARIVVPRVESCRQISIPGGIPWLMTGTAWMIGPQLAITNHHVINARRANEPLAAHTDFAEQGRLALLEFDFDEVHDKKFVVPATRVEAASQELDYAILRLAQSVDRPPLRLMREQLEVNASTYMPVNIVQHPQGNPKRIAIRNNLVAGSNNNLLRYFTDTDYGSSGSPVCDDNWKVVALHRGAQFLSDVQFQGKHTAYVNFGTQIGALLQDIQSNNIKLFDEIINM